ncbi:gag-pol polyprotein, partial [Trifolium medium]|nr:gag-pol polyprotein [Trifolium medium]
MEGETLYIYLVVSTEAVSVVLVREIGTNQNPVYFISKALSGPKLTYQKIALALMTAARKLRRYFLAHAIVVWTDQPLKQVLFRPDLAGRMTMWSVELSEFDISFEPWKTLKAQAFADFLAELTPGSVNPCTSWTVFTDGSSNSKGSVAGLILESEEGLVIEVSLKFSFPVTNNQAEYEACIAGVDLALEMGAKHLKLRTNSQLVVTQIKGEAQAKEQYIQKYMAVLKKKVERQETFEATHIQRDKNTRADVLARLASTRPSGVTHSFIQETL